MQMTVISIPGGSKPEILKLVKKIHECYPNQIQVNVFDQSENIGTEEEWLYEKCLSDEDAVRKAVLLVKESEKSILLKGMVQTHTLLKEVLKSEHQLKLEGILSHVALVTLPNHQREFLLTDCAMNIAPNTETLINIVENVKSVAHKQGIDKPKIALLSSAENFNPKMPSSVLAKEVTEAYQDCQDGIVFGPISFDLAISPESVKHKGYVGPIQGDADVLVVPVIDAGNILYKSLTLFGGAEIGGMVVGTKVPVVLTSRSDSTESKFQSLEFALKQIGFKK